VRTAFRGGGRVQLTEQTLARGMRPAAEQGSGCRSKNPTVMTVRVAWDSYGWRGTLDYPHEFLRKVYLGHALRTSSK